MGRLARKQWASKERKDSQNPPAGPAHVLLVPWQHQDGRAPTYVPGARLGVPGVGGQADGAGWVRGGQARYGAPFSLGPGAEWEGRKSRD